MNPNKPANLQDSYAVKIALTALVILLFVAAFGHTYARLTSSSTIAGNTFATGTVAISDNDSGAAMFAISNAKPGDSASSCIRLTYTGSLASSVRLYGTTSGTGLDAYLTITVTRGTLPAGAFGSCTGFTADGTNYIGAGAGVIYNGTLQAFADNYAAGIVDPTAASPESWTTGETHDYRFSVTLTDSDSAQSKTATQTFTWEARTP